MYEGGFLCTREEQFPDVSSELARKNIAIRILT